MLGLGRWSLAKIVPTACKSSTIVWSMPRVFDEIGAGNRPIRFVWHGVSRRQFVKGLAFLFGSDVALNRKGQPDFGR